MKADQAMETWINKYLILLKTQVCFIHHLHQKIVKTNAAFNFSWKYFNLFLHKKNTGTTVRCDWYWTIENSLIIQKSVVSKISSGQCSVLISPLCL